MSPKLQVFGNLLLQRRPEENPCQSGFFSESPFFSRKPPARWIYFELLLVRQLHTAILGLAFVSGIVGDWLGLSETFGG
jgi:hypothetical protein